ncbi:hypothetical protein [Thiorhodococcus minor]|nr:hypothetical protein [Thiorhodococcus minor]
MAALLATPPRLTPTSVYTNDGAGPVYRITAPDGTVTFNDDALGHLQLLAPDPADCPAVGTDVTPMSAVADTATEVAMRGLSLADATLDDPAGTNPHPTHPRVKI